MLSLDDADRHRRPQEFVPAAGGFADDAALMHRMQSGDERALAALYDRRAPVILASIMRVVPEQADAESILLETFSQAWRDSARYSVSRGPVLTWLFMIARSRALDFSRSSARTLRLMPMSVEHAPSTALEADGPTYDPSRRVEDDERSAIVASAMSSLTAPQRVAIELAFFDGLTHMEIAERLHEPLGTIKSRIRLAMTRLRLVLHPDGREHT